MGLRYSDSLNNSFVRFTAHEDAVPCGFTARLTRLKNNVHNTESHTAALYVLIIIKTEDVKQ